MRRALLGAALATGACKAAPAPSWHQESGYRWQELLPAGSKPDGFTRLTPSASGIDFANTVSDSAAYRNRHLMHGSGAAIGDVDGDGRPDIYLCRIEGPNALYLNLGGFKFREAARERGVALGDRPSTGAVFADVDGDGDLDLVVNAMGGRNSLFLNDGKGSFSDATAASGFAAEERGSTTAALADVDGDGDLDLYVANYKARTMLDSLSPQQRAFDQVVKQTAGTFAVIPERRADYRLQERKELNGVTLIQRADPDWFYLNDGSGHFTREPLAGNPRFLDESGQPLTEEPEDFGLAARFYDVNGDGAPDLYVANDFEDPDQFWINDGRGHFRLIPKQAVRRTANSNMAIDFADIDRDGQVDLFQVDMLANDGVRRKTQVPTHTTFGKVLGDYVERAQWQRNALLHSRGDGSFAEIADFAGVAASGWSWSALFLDVDLDGYEDLLIGNGHTWDLMDADIQERLKSTVTGVDWRQERKFYPALQLPNVAFRNRGDLHFEDASTRWHWGTEPDISHGLAAGDLDGDGDLDVVVNRLNAPVAIMRNDAAEPRIAIRALSGAHAAPAIGARVLVSGGPVRQSREITAGGLYLSGSDQELSFAARQATRLDLEVRWRDGRVSRVAGALPGRLYELRETGNEPFQIEESSPPAPLFQDLSAQLAARQVEKPFNDYVRQPLLDGALSQLGPGVSWIDVDGDGDDDLIVPDGAGGELAWYRNDGARFSRQPLGVAAGDLDFTGVLGLPGPGGTHLLVGRSTYRARTFQDAFQVSPVAELELAPGGRRVTRTTAVAPPDTASIGPLALADVDGDGDLDLFVAGRVLAGAFPVPPSSHLYRNVNGRFERDASSDPVFHQAGLVSSALFSDLDGDGDPDLALATDWGPIRLFLNSGGRFAEATSQWGLATLLGGWKGLGAGDFDGDGRIDLVATNWGHNVTFSADSTAPLYLYVGNFGGTPQVDLLPAAFDPRLKTIAPVASFSRLSWAIPDLRSRIPTFAEYAQASVEKVIGSAYGRAQRIQLTTLDHVVLLNRGSRFEVHALPAEAQLAPGFAAVAGDFDGDGSEDLFLGQNFSQTEIGTPRFDAGRGLLLRGDGKGGFAPLSGAQSGIVSYADMRGAAASDYDRDGRLDLAVGQSAAEAGLYHNSRAKPGLRVRLVGPSGNPAAVGAAVRVRYAGGDGPLHEVRAGGNYWSEDGLVVVLGLRDTPRAVWVRWPGGKTTEIPLTGNEREVVATVPPGSR